MESQEHLVPSSPSTSSASSSSSSSITHSGGNDDSSGAVGSGGSSSCSPGDDEDEHTLSCRGGAIEGAAEEVEGLITQTTDADQSVDYELVDLNTTTTVTTQVDDDEGPPSSHSTLRRDGDGGTLTPPTVPQSPSTPDLLYHHRHSSSHHPLPTLPPSNLDQCQDRRRLSGLPDQIGDHEHHASAAATLNRYSTSRDQRQRRQNGNRNFLHNNNFHNQSFTAINNADALRNASVHYTPNLNTFVNGSILHSNGVDNEGGDGGYSIPPYQSSLYACTNPNLSNGLATASTSNGFLQSDTFLPSDPTPLPNLNLGTDGGGCMIGNGGGLDRDGLGVIHCSSGDAAVDVDVCCKRFIPASFVTKINKLNSSSRGASASGGGGGGGGFFKTVGEFSLRENLYYGSIFFCMTLIVIVCFVVINTRGGSGGRNLLGASSGSQAAAIYDTDGHPCSGLLDPINGEVHQTGHGHGDRAIYTCANGWEIVGTEERVCQADGSWSSQEPFCKKRVYCLDPPVVHHSTHNGSPDAVTFPLETVLKYTCYPGYLTVGFAHAKCFLYNDTAQWFGPDITCKAIRCGEPEEIQNGDVDRKCQTFGCRISYQCRAGYELVGRQHRYCQADGSWSPRILPECVPIQCKVPENPENGRAVYASTSYNSLISYECTYGYMLIGDSVRRCERNKEWTGTKPNCKEINCGSPGILPNGWLEGTRTTLHAVVTFRCQEGMTFEGPSYRTICQADGRWSHPLPRCYAPCIVPHISHGFVSDRASGSSVPHANTIDVRCLNQFQKTHNSTPICKNGTWSRIPKCIPAKCTELPEAPQNGMVVAPKLDHGMVGKFECRDGYMLKGHNTTQCFFGNWTGMTPWCKEVFCPFPGFVENGKVLLVGAMGLYEYRPYVRKIRNNRQIMFQCDRGYLLVGGPTGATCIDGHWSPTQLPRCQAEEHPKARFSRSTLNATLTGSKADEDLSSSDYILEFDEKGVIAASGERQQMVLKQQPQTLQSVDIIVAGGGGHGKKTQKIHRKKHQRKKVNHRVKSRRLKK